MGERGGWEGAAGGGLMLGPPAEEQPFPVAWPLRKCRCNWCGKYAGAGRWVRAVGAAVPRGDREQGAGAGRGAGGRCQREGPCMPGVGRAGAAPSSQAASRSFPAGSALAPPKGSQEMFWCYQLR